nr:MAG TPA: hypothetical protein [Caudoviricetes sp.]DAM91590.1 MAG TPA: hypothetical protein [Caudoviricetes sp.]
MTCPGSSVAADATEGISSCADVRRRPRSRPPRRMSSSNSCGNGPSTSPIG